MVVVETLVEELERRVRGEVRFDAGTRALYATDASNYRVSPIGVIVPLDVDDVVAAVAVCRDHQVPILPRGCGTSLAGQCCNAAVVLDLSRYLNRVLEIDPDRRVARVQPGVILDDLRTAANRFGLTFGPDPATHDRCTLGGMIGNNSCGAHSVLAGLTSDNVQEMDVLLYDGTRLTVGPAEPEEMADLAARNGRPGEIFRRLDALITRYADEIRRGYPHIPRRVSGYNLTDLLPERGSNVARALVGSEGTCVTVLEATVNLVPWPAHRALVVLGYPDVYVATDDVPEIMTYGPIALEGFDEHLVADMRREHLDPDAPPLLPDGEGFLLAEFGGDTPEEAASKAERLMRGLPSGPKRVLYTDPQPQAELWRMRETALGAAALVPGRGEYWPGWEDSAVPPDQLGAYLRDMRALLRRYGYEGVTFYGHFGQGCTHMRIDFDLMTRAGIAQFRAFMNDAADLCVSFGGSLSGEHGDGRARSELLPRMFSPPLMQAFGEFKAIWDPDDRMNPGNIVRPAALDADLRLGTDYRPAPVTTHFRFPQDGGSFAAATRRCVGVGICRRTDGGVMCPSFQVTREEKHTTRGRAHLLFEMLEGKDVRGLWRSEEVKEALDLCLSCKGCKHDCPVRVDVATYKAEFLSHYYQGRPRPRSGYAMGFIHTWARLASRLPVAVNALLDLPGAMRVTKVAAGVSPHRSLPRFASCPFTTWIAQRRSAGAGKPVVLFPDTFTNYFNPEIGMAAVEVLEAAGYQVKVPARDLCCGRPLYDYGFLDQARSSLLTILDTLREDIAAGTPVIVLEPSCAATFRDELIEMLPDHKDAVRLAGQTVLFSEFLVREGIDVPAIGGRAILQGHCHHKAIFGMAAEETVLRALDLDYTQPNPGCCGMAGSFGFEADHYDISVAVGERHLLPAVRSAPPSTLIVADGFSCREQIGQMTGRRAVHLAQVVDEAVKARRG
ncbi:MAG TPA: FAD-binding and (Fe-S)-binding domain-containing protein [Chloroflexota bacterium]|nr:FAD-binding and (Fe-S)-binding domain-containing protein [Chloroflexota bacterium]